MYQQKDGNTSLDYSFVPLQTKIKLMFGHYMKLSMTPTCSYESTFAFQRLNDPTWPNYYVPRMSTQ